MEIKSLVLGVLFSLGIFAVKTGIGLAGYLAGRSDRSGRLRMMLIFCGGYGLLFGAVAVGLGQLDLLQVVPVVQRVLQGGMAVHFIMAALMLWWGLALLRSPEDGNSAGRGWIALVVPCPVCLTVIAMSLGFLGHLFPGKALQTTALLYLVFLGLSSFSLLMFRWAGAQSSRPSRQWLGSAMVVMAAYFLLSLIIMPSFGALDEVSRLAAQTGRDKKTGGWILGAVAGGAMLLFGLGYFLTWKRDRRMTS
jgi:predicted transporter